MKKVFASALAVFAFTLILSSCSQSLPDNAEVRFQNSTDLFIKSGLKFGDAEYIGGDAGPGFISPYYTTAPGTYPVQALGGASWVTISDDPLSVDGGHMYTILGTGSGGDYSWDVVQDQ